MNVRVQVAITAVGFRMAKARLVAEAFEGGARVERKWIVSPKRAVMWGTA